MLNVPETDLQDASTNGEAHKRVEHLSTKEADINIPRQVVKRDGRIVSFDTSRIEDAIRKCFASINRTPRTDIPTLTNQAVNVVGVRRNLLQRQQH